MPLSSQDSTVAEVVARLMSDANRDRSFDAAQMQLINLPEIIEQAGSHWDKIKDKIRAGSLTFLRGCLSDKDFVLPAGDGFLIIFDEKNTQDALHARAQELRGMLLEFYIGQQELKRLQLHVTTTTVTPDELDDLFVTPAASFTSESAVSWMFAPIWTARAQIIASYLCTPIRSEEFGRAAGYDAGYLSNGHCEHRDFAKTDLDMLDAIEQVMFVSPPGATRPMLGASVHSTTMQNRAARAAYLERLSRMAPEVKKHLFVRVAEIETGTPLIAMADWAGMLRGRLKHIFFEFHHSETAPPDLTHVGLWGAGYRAAPQLARAGADLKSALRQVAAWSSGLKRLGVFYGIMDIARAELAGAAASAGAHLLSGDALWPYSALPSGVRKSTLISASATTSHAG